jgi:glyoxylate reductase
MGKPKVLVTSRLPSAALDLLFEKCDVDYRDESSPMPQGELLERVKAAEGLVCQLTNTIGRDVLDAGPKLRVIANVAVGYNNVDVQSAKERGVMVTNTPDVLTEATADLTLGLMLGIMRRLAEGDRLIRRGGWSGFNFTFMLGSDPRGKQLGILGMGRIGQAVARRAVAFGMTIAYMPGPRSSKGGPAGPGGGSARREFEGFSATPMGFDELLATSDVVSLHLPLTGGTRHLINQRALARMKASSYLINVARGPVVDEEALVWALNEGVISGAGLDVFEDEPNVHPGLLKLENVVLAPHIGSATRETRTAMAALAVQNCVSVLSGERPLTPVPEMVIEAAERA